MPSGVRRHMIDYAKFKVPGGTNKTDWKPGIYKCYVLQYAPGTFECLNVGVLVSDGHRSIAKFVGHDLISILTSAMPDLGKYVLHLDRPTEWTDRPWPTDIKFDSLGYAMSSLKYHVYEPIVSVEGMPEFGLSLEEFGQHMFEESCVWTREGIFGNDPEAIRRRLARKSQAKK